MINQSDIIIIIIIAMQCNKTIRLNAKQYDAMQIQYGTVTDFILLVLLKQTVNH